MSTIATFNSLFFKAIPWKLAQYWVPMSKGWFLSVFCIQPGKGAFLLLFLLQCTTATWVNDFLCLNVHCKHPHVSTRKFLHGQNIVSSLGISSEVVGDKSNVLFCFFCQKRIEGLFSLRKFFSSFPAIDVKKLLKWFAMVKSSEIVLLSMLKVIWWYSVFEISVLMRFYT